MDFRQYNGQNGDQQDQKLYEEVFQENGRWYGTFKKGSYLFPIDEKECERLDVFHKIFLVARGEELHKAPIPPDAPKVLDLGCGTGIWSINMADKYPGGTHLGLDLSYIQPEYIPHNLRFMQRDVEAPWEGLEPGSWDLIHARTLNGSIGNWPRVYAEVYRHLKRGGYFEQVEIDFYPRCDDGTLPRNAFITQWANELFDAMDYFGRPLRMDSNLTKQWLVQAGFSEIKEEVIKLPLNGWPTDNNGRELGRWFNLGMCQAFQPLSLAPLYRSNRRSVADIYDMAEKARAEVFSTQVHAYCNLHIFTARKLR